MKLAPTQPDALSDALARHAQGLRARKQLARSAHGAFSADSFSPDPLALLHAAERNRLPRLLPIKHQRMAHSPFGFFRGAVPIMAADLAAHPNTGLITQLCGDAHVLNLGAFEDATGNLVFDINDFDETLRGPFEFDLKRLATSLLLAGAEAGIKRSVRCEAVLHFAQQYRTRMHRFAAMPILELARWQIHRLAARPPMPAILAQAQRSTPLKSVAALTELVPARAAASPQRRFQSHPPLLTRVTGKEKQQVLAALGPYARTLQPERRHFLDQYRALDVAFKVVGTGSVGLRDYVVYFEGTRLPDKSAKPDKKAKSSKPSAGIAGSAGSNDPLFLQIKEEPASAYAAYLPEGSQHTHNGHRVMDGQRALQLTSDPFLGYTTLDGRDFLVRQLNDHKAALDLTCLDAPALLGYADVCGELFARGHARAGDPVSLAAYLGSSARFDEALLHFAEAYAERTDRCYELFKKSLK